jgi:plasmid stabilization system protein ParE
VAYGLLAESRKLAELPLYGRVVPEYKQDSIREILKRPYRIIYRLNGGQVDVLTVMHYRQLLPKDLNGLLRH